MQKVSENLGRSSSLTQQLVTKGLATVVAISIMVFCFAGSAAALEVETSVKSIDPNGAITLPLPDGAMVAIGDKVRVLVTSDALEPTSIKTRWTVEKVDDGTIHAKPDGAPTGLPKEGFKALINTVANQPGAAEMAKAEPEKDSKIETRPTIEETAKATPPAPEPTELVEETAKVEAADVEANVTPAPEAASKPEMSPAKSKDDIASAPVKEEPVAETGVVNKPIKNQEGEESKEEAVVAASKAAEEPTAPEKKTTPEKASPETETAALRPALPAEEETALATPAPVQECDRLAAHPFDPDAVTAGVEYPDLVASKIITACEEAISEFPSERRFYGQLGRGLHKAGKLHETFEATMKGAELGSAHAMAYVGVMYKTGEGVAKDLSKSLGWFEKAAEQGNPGGMVFAAAMYRDGTGTTPNDGRAAELYQMAADLNIAEAMTSLGIFYDRGQGVVKDVEKARDYILKALKNKDREAAKLLFEAPETISKGTREAIQAELQRQGFYNGKIDGDFGSRTRDALIRFRRS